MYEPPQKKNSSWTPSTVQKKGKSPSKLGHFSIQPKPNPSSTSSQEIGEYSRDSADRLTANVMRGIQAKKQEEAEGSTLQPKFESPWAPTFEPPPPLPESPASKLKGAFAPVSKNPIQPKPNPSSESSQEIGEYSRTSMDRLAANVMRSLQTREQEIAEESIQPKFESPWAPTFEPPPPLPESPASKLKGAFAPVSKNPIQRQCAECAKEEEEQKGEERKDVEEIGIQTKLTVGAPGDSYEQEADRVASQVMSMSAPADSSASVQRQLDTNHPHQIWKRAQSIKPVMQRQIDPRVQMREMIQRAHQIDGNQASGDLESRLNASKGGGSPLSEDVRGFMEPRFGADFSGVRVHTGGEAVQMNQELGAQAFTHGSDVYFGEGKTPGNNELTAHELTHVVQQTGVVQQQTTPSLSTPSLPTLRADAPSQVQPQRKGKSEVGEWTQTIKHLEALYSLATESADVDKKHTMKIYRMSTQVTHKLNKQKKAIIAEAQKYRISVIVTTHQFNKLKKWARNHFLFKDKTEELRPCLASIKDKKLEDLDLDKPLVGSAGLKRIEEIKRQECCAAQAYVALEGKCTIGYGHVVRGNEQQLSGNIKPPQRKKNPPNKNEKYAIENYPEGTPTGLTSCSSKHSCQQRPLCTGTPTINEEVADELLRADYGYVYKAIQDEIPLELTEEQTFAFADLLAAGIPLTEPKLKPSASEFIKVAYDLMCTDPNAVREQYMKTGLKTKGSASANHAHRRQRRVWSESKAVNPEAETQRNSLHLVEVIPDKVQKPYQDALKKQDKVQETLIKKIIEAIEVADERLELEINKEYQVCGTGRDGSANCQVREEESEVCGTGRDGSANCQVREEESEVCGTGRDGSANCQRN